MHERKYKYFLSLIQHILTTQICATSSRCWGDGKVRKIQSLISWSFELNRRNKVKCILNDVADPSTQTHMPDTSPEAAYPRLRYKIQPHERNKIGARPKEWKV